MGESLTDRTLVLAEALFADMDRLRCQMFAPTVEHKAMVVSDGKDAGSHVELVEIEMEEPSFQSKRLIVAAVAEGLSKVLQLAELGAADDDDDWTAPAGTTSIRDAQGRKSGDVRPGGGGRAAAHGQGADAASAARVGRRA